MNRVYPTRTLLAAALALGVAPTAFAQDADSALGLTIYSSADPAGFDAQQFIAQQRLGHDPNFAGQVPGFGVVRETRSIDLEQGLNTVNFTDVARFIDPTTVSFVDLENPQGTAVLEQTLLFDLVSPSKLLEKYTDQQVTVRVPTGDTIEELTGTLLSSNAGQIVLQTGEGLRMIPMGQAQVQFGAMPGGLITKPTLQWLIQSDAADDSRRVRTSYQTNGITWKADYNLILNEDDTQADLGAWVTILNLSGKAYPNTELKLIAGDVQRIQPRPPMPMAARAVRMEMAADMAAPGFEEKTFFEYHMYTLPRRTNIADNTTQQLTLFPTATGVNVEKVMVYYGLPEAAQWGFFPNPVLDRNFGNQSNKKVDVYVRFENEEENRLGMPLPRGKVRVFKMDAPAAGNAEQEGTLEFVGEDLIDHTPRGEKVLIKVGQAFDVVGERTQTNFTMDERNHVVTESFRIQLRNHKDEAVKVVVKENLYRWVNWEITQESAEHEKVDTRTVHWELEVPADGEQTLTYTVKYTW